jgi:hypothetical protein
MSIAAVSLGLDAEPSWHARTADHISDVAGKADFAQQKKARTGSSNVIVCLNCSKPRSTAKGIQRSASPGTMRLAVLWVAPAV